MALGRSGRASLKRKLASDRDDDGGYHDVLGFAEEDEATALGERESEARRIEEPADPHVHAREEKKERRDDEREDKPKRDRVGQNLEGPGRR